jgi:hypothetical protein
MANRQEWEHPTAITGAVVGGAGPRRRVPDQRPADQEWSSVAVQTVGAAADPERHFM